MIRVAYWIRMSMTLRTMSGEDSSPRRVPSLRRALVEAAQHGRAGAVPITSSISGLALTPARTRDADRRAEDRQARALHTLRELEVQAA